MSRSEAKLRLEWRAPFDNPVINRLHAEAFDHAVLADDWWAQVNRFSLGWVVAREASTLVGFVNIAWDGGVHAFVLDTMVTLTHRRRGIARSMLGIAANEARRARCEWLHADFGPELNGFYLGASGFTATPAGLIALREPAPRAS